MKIKYIQKDKEGKWRVSNAKAEKTTKIFNTQREAVEYAAAMKSTESILIKGKNGHFRKLTTNEAAIFHKAQKANHVVPVKAAKAKRTTTVAKKTSVTKKSSAATKVNKNDKVKKEVKPSKPQKPAKLAKKEDGSLETKNRSKGHNKIALVFWLIIGACIGAGIVLGLYFGGVF